VRAALASVLLFGALAALGACGGEGDPIDPVPVLLSGDAGVPLPDAGPDAEPPDPPVKRTVMERNPFGNVAESENLLWDGDFEWSSPFADQYGWLTGSKQSLGYSFDGVKIGAACRSGIKCATVPKNRVLVGIGVGSKGHKLEASFQAKPSTPSCADINAELISESSDGSPDAPLTPVAESPDAGGWCRFGVVAEERPEKTYLFISNETDGEILVDDAVMKTAPKGVAIQVAQRVPTAFAIEELEAVRAELRRRKGPHDPPPNAARRAFEKWRNK